MNKQLFLNLLLVVLILFSANCKKQTNTDIIKSEMEGIAIRNSKSIQTLIPPGMHYLKSNDVLPAGGQNIFIYNSDILETQWGSLFGKPFIYLFDKENNLLETYDVQKLINDEFYGGSIEIFYNNERNSFDLTFSFGGYGDYGTAYIDLNTYEIVRELLLQIDEQFEYEL